MARKKKKTIKKIPPALTILIALIILFSSAAGIAIPDSVWQRFSFEETTTTTVEKNSTETENSGPIENGQATFSEDDLVSSKKGWIDYQDLDSLGRATGANALLTKAMIGTGTSADQDIRPAGFISGLDPYNHSRGHLIGKQLGGSGEDARNLVTLYQNPVNTPYMTSYENKIRSALETGEKIRYRVTPIYSGEKLMCTAIRLEAKSITANGSIDFNVTILNEK